METQDGGQRPQRADIPERATETEARQGVTGHNVRIVLGVSFTLAVIAGVILYFTVGN
jgi:hypothetical protein